MRTSQAAYGIIKHRFVDTDKYLLRINRGWNNQFNFISGHIEPEDQNDFLKTVIRETEEELAPILFQKEFVVSTVSEKPFQRTAFSLSAQTMTRYTFYLFQILFIAPVEAVAFLWQAPNSPNRWFTKTEMLNGAAKSGERISRFPIPQMDAFIPGGLASLGDSFIEPVNEPRERVYEVC